MVLGASGGGEARPHEPVHCVRAKFSAAIAAAQTVPGVGVWARVGGAARRAPSNPRRPRAPWSQLMSTEERAQSQEDSF